MRQIFLFTFFACIVASCSLNYHKIAQRMNKEAFPKDLTNSRYTLLVLKWGKKWVGDKGNDKAIEKFNEKLSDELSKLSYPAIAIAEEELASGKYDDVNKYRYLLRPYESIAAVEEVSSAKQPGGGSMQRQSTTEKFHNGTLLYRPKRKESLSVYQLQSFFLRLWR